MSDENMDLELCLNTAIEKYGDMIYRIAVNQMKNRTDADDIFQEVFIKWMQHHEQMQNSEHEKAWLIRVTLNQCKSALGSTWNKRKAEWSQEVENTMVYEDQIEEGSDLDEVLNTLPERYRSVLHLFYYEELSISEIGNVLQEKESTVRTRLTRARRKLKSMLKGVEL